MKLSGYHIERSDNYFVDYHNSDRFDVSDSKGKLYVCGYGLNGREENEFTTIVVEYMRHLELKSCEGMSKGLLDCLTNPTSLRKLTITKSKGVECLLTYDQFKAPQLHLKSQFQALEHVELCELDDFMGVIHKLEIEDATLDPPPSSAFSSLSWLGIYGCGKMKKLGLPLSVFEKLEVLFIEKCEEIEEIIQVAAMGASDDTLFIYLPNLKLLHLAGLPSLESFCDASLICNLLEDFKLSDCPRLEVPFLKWGTHADSYKPLFPVDGAEEIRRHSS